MKTKQDLASLNQGLIPSRNLNEILKIDFKTLAEANFPDLPKDSLKKIGSLKTVGILKRMTATANILSEWDKEEALKIASEHPSDTMRGWAVFILGAQNTPLKEKLKNIKQFADDEHFGVREWAWMAVRNDIISNLDLALKTLAPWTKSKSFRVRRFATEATRPRGVWAAHINKLKENPETGLPLLVALKNDPERYVQDSVANWLNDASKTSPAWVRSLCSEWKKDRSSSTDYIIKRALRSLK